MSKKCRIFVYTATMIFLSIFVFCCASFFHRYGVFSPRFTLLGEKQVILPLNTSYKEEGFEVYYHFSSYQDEVEITDNIDTTKVGTYQISYYTPTLGIVKKRIVKVVDTVKPVLNLIGEEKVYVFVNTEYEELGASAYDNCDKDISSKIMISSDVNIKKAGTYSVKYSVKDMAGNKSSIKRKVIVCENPEKTSIAYHHDSYDNTAMQWWFKKSVDHKRNEGAITQETLKQYDAYYLGEDAKVLYLTFDEGGSEKTYIKEIANLLNRYEITGTFFLTKNYILQEAEFIRDLIANGHVIGNHTHNHLNMATLANQKDVDAFCKEITSVEKAYMQVSGQKMKKVFRFPKGEASERTMKMVSDLGYKTFFWSHAYYDYGETLSYDTALKNMMNYHHNGAIYLMHPNNKGNYDALETFIKEMLEQGYTFKTVDQIK